MNAATDTKTKAVVFDMDDTLYAERDYVRSGYDAISRHLAEASNSATANISTAATATKLSNWMWQRFLNGNSEGMFNALSDNFDLALDKAAIAQLVEIYREHKPDIAPHEDIPPLLSVLSDAKFKLGILSDGFIPAQRYKLDALGLADNFDAVIFTEELGRQYWKPAAKGFENIATALGTSHNNCIYIGDNPAKDFVAPNSLGWRSIQWKRPGQVHSHKQTHENGQPQHIISSAAELLQILNLHT